VGAALSNDVGKPPTLDYATPQEGKNPFARVIFGILGVFAAVFGILVTFFGIYSLLWFTTNNVQTDRGDYIFNLCAEIIVGALSLFLCSRWLGYSFTSAKPPRKAERVPRSLTRKK
jgi:hypothetical protein